ncbi:MAG: thrombospondin type 3 repeat-containing protein [Nitrososphaeraceae archaeon]
MPVMGDTDGDGATDENDNCFQPNSDLKDSDNDGVGDVCDLTPGNTLAPGLAPTEGDQTDSDGDGLLDAEDNVLQYQIKISEILMITMSETIVMKK